MTALPDIPALVKRTKALAALDLILSPEWEFRYYSFDVAWGSGEMMASMRDGCGDEWWMVFHSDGWAALKGLAHESPAWAQGGKRLSRAIQKSFPRMLRTFSKEPAFRWAETGFAYFYTPVERRWTRANDLTRFVEVDAGEDHLLRHLVGDPETYCEFAEYYYETGVPIGTVRRVFDQMPISPEMVSGLNPDVSFEDIGEELHSEIGYPR